MLKTFKVENIKCDGCANTLKTKLKDKFGDVEVNLDVMPREITLDIDESREEELKASLRKLGYPFSKDQLSTFQTVETKAKSFISCAIGKINK